MLSSRLQQLRTPKHLLLLMSVAMPLAFATWQALLNNYVIDRAGFTGAEIGILQSLREIPGFLSFTAVFVLLLIKEQRFAFISLLILGVGVAATGYFSTALGLYFVTVLMSVGFHYFETVKQSLSLQWLSKTEAPHALGQMIAAGAVASLVVYGFLWLNGEFIGWGYRIQYLLGGGLCVLLTLFLWLAYPRVEAKVPQHKHLVFRRRYWLYYALTFMSGARRQIFTVFAAFLMVEKFGYNVEDIALLFLINHLINWFFAPKIGGWIGRIGERSALTFEYLGLIGIFVSYAVVNNGHVAAGLYVTDHLFFSLAIAIKTYFQKIADAEDIAATASVSFTINHIAAVVIPALFGLLWLVSPAAVFLLGAGMATCSLVLARNIPRYPEKGNEMLWGRAPMTVRAETL